MTPEQQDHVEHFRARVLAQALLDGWSIHNERQAARWAAARPRADDYLGQSTLEQQRERYYRMTAVASAYRNRSTIVPFVELVDTFDSLWEAS
ncbi:hypothetical protein ENKNEFLB_02820 [Nocardioides aquaticus]|uniref:Uncharacterized protein n=1 Tax=Nocardioides aquaticus TaxID=160826 RepID=A0ABX8EKJ6_9ACTN|nr:hypothetical protein [Nocardioides aquaticus]QVT80425.1 hypothetical protein ENKNEFLB_02820 [Nocardioides aquaticus]